MLLSLIGNIGTGKSTFARWFIRRHPSWIHKSIDDFRLKSSQIAQTLRERNPIQIENRTWEFVTAWCNKNLEQDKIFEHTGTIYRVNNVYHNKLIVQQGIYVVKLVGSANFCKRNIKSRQKAKMPYPYDMNDCEGADINKGPGANSQANVIAYVDAEEIELIDIYKKLEDKILLAKTIFDTKEVGKVTLKN